MSNSRSVSFSPSTSAASSVLAMSLAGRARFSSRMPFAYDIISKIALAPSAWPSGVRSAVCMRSVRRYSSRPSSSGMPISSAIT